MAAPPVNVDFMVPLAASKQFWGHVGKRSCMVKNLAVSLSWISTFFIEACSNPQLPARVSLDPNCCPMHKSM